MKRYQLRYAAGTYWLSDTNPEGSVIPRPLELNETATEIWKMLEEHDIEQFIEQLRQNNIDI